MLYHYTTIPAMRSILRDATTNGSTVFYREMHLPIHLLKCVYVKTEATREEVGRYFAELGVDVPVRNV